MRKKVEMNNQAALDYVLYMIAGSYFKKASCERSQYQERRLFMEYFQEAKENQYLMEELCITYMEKALMKKLPQEIWEQEVTAHLVKLPDMRNTCVIFKGESFRLELTARKTSSRRISVTCMFWQRGGEMRRYMTGVRKSADPVRKCA